MKITLRSGRSLTAGSAICTSQIPPGSHESTIREYRIFTRDMTIGEPLEAFQGVYATSPLRVTCQL
ncbi:hypothetical protein [Pseudomonas serboccidentalis]|uniref:hypothetical protein n=1 Tax=Pseudomonas serboccidentalis TaxID=2964670 RepID=UPI0039E11230